MHESLDEFEFPPDKTMMVYKVNRDSARSAHGL